MHNALQKFLSSMFLKLSKFSMLGIDCLVVINVLSMTFIFSAVKQCSMNLYGNVMINLKNNA